MNTTRLTEYRNVPKLFSFNADRNVQREAIDNATQDARTAVHARLIDSIEPGLTYLVKRTEDQRAPNAGDDTTHCIIVVTLELIASIDTLL